MAHGFCAGQKVMFTGEPTQRHIVPETWSSATARERRRVQYRIRNVHERGWTCPNLKRRHWMRASDSLRACEAGKVGSVAKSEERHTSSPRRPRVDTLNLEDMGLNVRRRRKSRAAIRLERNGAPLRPPQGWLEHKGGHGDEPLYDGQLGRQLMTSFMSSGSAVESAGELAT
jgi:hypothetical protein